MNPRSRKISASVATLISLGSAVMAYHASSGDRTGGPHLRLRSPSLVGEIRVGEHKAVEIALENSSSKPIRVVGSSDGCGPHACFTGRGMPVAIPPHGRGTIVVDVKGTSVGPFSDTILIYTEEEGLGKLEVDLVGQVVDAVGEDADVSGRYPAPGDPT